MSDITERLDDFCEYGHCPRAQERDEARAEIIALRSRLEERQKYWDDEKRRYDAADKAFRQVCDERDSLSLRLGRIRELTESWSAADTQARLQDVLNDMAAVAWEGVENVTADGMVVEPPEVDSKSRLKRIAIQRGESGEDAYRGKDVERRET